MIDPIDARLALAEILGEAAGQRALAFFNARDTLIVENKANPQDMVSQADQEVEVLLREGILAKFPGDAILGEEGGSTGGSSGFTWVLDPIDGTAPFLAGLPHWCVSISIVQSDVDVAGVQCDTCVAGVIDHPMAAERFTARKGAGAWLNGKPMQVRADLQLNNCNFGTGISHRSPLAPYMTFLAELLDAGGMFYRNGSGAVMLAQVAAGRLGGYYEPHMNAWDCLAGLLMVEEAGGRVLPFPALPEGGLVLACAPQIYDRVAVMIGMSNSA